MAESHFLFLVSSVAAFCRRAPKANAGHWFAGSDFCLPGIDGQNHCLKDYASSKVLVIAFTCNHCPTSQLYEKRIQQLADDYKDKGVTLVAIEPNNPDAVLLDEMGYTDVGDSLEDMKVRAEYRHFTFPYLYDGEDQKIATAYGPTATPHLFIFDSDRKAALRRPRRQQHARAAGHQAGCARCPRFVAGWENGGGRQNAVCWLFDQVDLQRRGRRKEMEEIAKKPVDAKPLSIDELKALRKNTTGKLLLVDFWATWCGPCRQELPEFETMYRMYGHRAFDLVTVSINYPDEKPGVMKALNAEHATSTNHVLSSTDIYAQLAAFDPDWNAAVPYTLADCAGRGNSVQEHGLRGRSGVEAADHRQFARR